MSSPAPAQAAIDIDLIRSQFPSLATMDKGRPRIYLDNPAGTQVPQVVADRMADCLLHRSANIGGYFKTSELAGAVADEARSAMVDFLNAPSPDEIIFGQNMTSLTLHLARSVGQLFQPGDEIVLSRMDHDANVAPWLAVAEAHDLTVRWVGLRPDDATLDEMDALWNRMKAAEKP